MRFASCRIVWYHEALPLKTVRESGLGGVVGAGTDGVVGGLLGFPAPADHGQRAARQGAWGVVLDLVDHFW